VRPLFIQLSQHPQLPQLRQLVLGNPPSIELIKQQLSNTNPVLQQAIEQYPQVFERVITGSGAAGGEGEGRGEGRGRGGHAFGGRGRGGGGRGFNPFIAPFGRGKPQQQQPLTDDDNNKIQQIIDMTSATKEVATQAYLNSNKNVELAINIIFDQ
jgi:hypothetical protein